MGARNKKAWAAYMNAWYHRNSDIVNERRRSVRASAATGRVCARCNTVVGSQRLVCGPCQAEQKRTKARARYTADLAHGRAVNRKKRASNPERYKLASIRWHEKHPGAAVYAARKRRVAMLGAPGEHTPQEWLAVRQMFDQRCAYCGVRFSLHNRSQQDHVMPLSAGGSDDIGNIVPACKSCNSRKGPRGILSMVNVQYGGA